jgi:hypothetical protein
LKDTKTAVAVAAERARSVNFKIFCNDVWELR